MEEIEVKIDEKTKKAETKPQKKWKKILSWVLTALLIAVLVFCLITVVQMKTSKKPFVLGYAVFYVVSGSMDPTIKVGEVIVVKGVSSPDELQKGDIITFRGKGGNLEGKTVTHRIISDGVVNGAITTCGDANHGIADDPITFDDVIGKYVKTSAFLTNVYLVFTNKVGFLFIIFIPLLALLVVQVVNFRRACRMDKDGKTPEQQATEQAGKDAVKEKEEEIKRKAIEEYLASKKRIEDAERGKKKE